MVQELGIAIVAFQPAHWQVAVEAFERFGKRRHPAQLNFGVCLTYALVKHSDQPLLHSAEIFPRPTWIWLSYPVCCPISEAAVDACSVVGFLSVKTDQATQMNSAASVAVTRM